MKIKKRVKNDGLAPYIYVAPSICFILFIYFYPLLRTIRNSFYRFSGGTGTFNRLGNYAFILFKDVTFRVSFFNNIKLLLGVPILTILSLLIATLIYQQVKGWKVFRIIKVLPYILPITVIGIIFNYILRLNGLLNTFLRGIGLDALALDWMGNPNYAIYSILAVVIWKELGFGVILFLARMLSIDPSLYDASKVDGASWLRTLFNITIPELVNVIVFYVIINIINFLSWMFNYIFVMSRGGPIHSTYVIEFYVYRLGIRYRQIGVASSAAVILLLLSMIFVILQYVIRKRLLRSREV